MGRKIRIVRSPVAGLEGREVELGPAGLEIGRDEGCALPLAGDTTASRRHAAVAPTPEGARLTDLGSANGVWVGEVRVADHLLRPGDLFRVGSTWLQLVVAAEELPAGAAEKTTAMAIGGALAGPLPGLGERAILGGNNPFLLDEPGSLWVVDDGRVEIFEVELEEGVPRGARRHFVTVEAGEALFGMELDEAGLGSGFLAVGRPGTAVRRIAVADLQARARTVEGGDEAARLVDRWIRALSRGLAAEIAAGRPGDLLVEPGTALPVEGRRRVRAAREVVWCSAGAGELLFVGMEPVALAPGLPFPLAPESWAELAGRDGRPIELETAATREGVGSSALWRGLQAFHVVLSRCELVNKRLSRVDDLRRLRSKTEYAQAAGEAGVEALASVLEARPAEAGPAAEAPAGDLVAAVRLVAGAQGIEVRLPPDLESRESAPEQLAVLARASRFRSREVALRGPWWQGEHGPLLGRWEGGGPVALLPRPGGGYLAVDPARGSREVVDGEVVGRLAGFATCFYRALGTADLGIRGLARFAARGLGRELVRVALLAVGIGLLGMAAPIFTGRILDAAIPQAERSLLVHFGLGLVVVAASSALFRLCQAVATIRIQSQMDLAAQAALWDRLLDLPALFFRRYSAGDLADRAFGISAIRDLVSQAGIGAVLGGLASLFYLALMAVYSGWLTAVAVAASLVVVAVATAANLWQLRLQREQLALRGRIAGLVHQLISGIAKIRVGGAERHAFRVWAEGYSRQRRLAFRAGSIQNQVEVFGAAFSLLSLAAIFAAMGWLQPAGEAGPRLTTGQFVAFLTAFGAFTSALLSLSSASLNLLLAVPIYERLRPVLEEIPETVEARSWPGRLEGRIRVSHVHFRYEREGPWTLRDVSLEIAPGELVALVGPSGSGKSTLLRLLLGFETPAKGSVSYDDQDLATLDLREVRQQLGVVLQESRVLPADLFHNIVGSSSRTLDEAWAAAEAAGLADDIRAMPMQMHTYVPEDGGGLSGGQRQRLLIARALVAKPRILFLDEATSALDNRTQAMVVESMDRLAATRVVIAHRLSTIVHADRIYYLENGELLEQGTYEELLARNGRFALLARRQMA